MAVAKFCPECGSPTQGGKFCPECGTATALGVAQQETDAAAMVPAEGEPITATSAPDEAPIDLDDDEREVWSGVPDAMLSPVAKRTTKYVITSERIRFSSGLMGKKMESLDLFRIKDIQVKKSMTQRARGKGDVRVTSTDPSTPMFTFESIAGPEEVAETLRKLVQDARRKHGVATQERM
jgi:uncharacterized Zn finger protein (UPF0148 family)